MPGIIEYPALVKEHGVVSAPAVTSDYFPTCCELLGIDLEDFSRPYDGISLIPFLTGEQNSRERPIGFNGLAGETARIGDRYKLFHNAAMTRQRWDSDSLPVAEYELYDLLEDPSETMNLAQDLPAILEEMKKQLNTFSQSCSTSDQGADY